MKTYRITQSHEGAIALENVSFSSPFRVNAWIRENYPKAPPLKEAGLLAMVFGVVRETTDPVSGMTISVSILTTSGPDWRAIAMALWGSESEEDKVIQDFGSIAITSATWPEGSLREDFRKENPKETLYKKVELFVE